ncbi:hypothetical protein M9H77_04748 [Catharanthus roseus]|uniref:Uncharacterized protein n=1 Tax=Catharanthus roseus TaxID=4058 RepID=A0ACC0CF55_CATRO|nr:hypothetical protein M9H77_04748 [Catharanthus roseus]
MQRSEVVIHSTLLVATIFILSCYFFQLPIEANNKDFGFSINLIHRHSLQSPFYNPNSSQVERRLNQIGKTGMVPDTGGYLMKISYGTPPVEILSLIDSGSDISWIQCLPCTKCIPTQCPPFNPKHSKTFEYIPCPTSTSSSSSSSENNNPLVSKPCPYEVRYLDDGYSRGEFVKDTITIGSPSQKVTFPGFVFGCGHDNGGKLPHKSGGLIGFGPDDVSFISQLSSSIKGKFSFCFAPITSSSHGKLSFGSEAVISGPGVVSTPLILADYYYVMLDGISIGTQRLKYVPTISNNDESTRKVTFRERIMLDSGTTYIYLPLSFHVQVEVAIMKQIKLKPVKNHLPFTLCYPSTLRNSDIPKIIFHFAGGADVELTMHNIFNPIQHHLCLGILQIFHEEHAPIYGNLAMTDFLVGFDLVEKKVSFKRMDCSRS